MVKLRKHTKSKVIKTDKTQMKIIARIHNGFTEKFGIPRQSGIVQNSESVIVFEKEYRDENALRGIEEFSHLWLIWHFSENKTKNWSPTVRPPRLGGNKRMGVFATRSPNRPNPIGLSSVKLVSVKKTKEYGTVLVVTGADLLDLTPIFDIKPYLAFTDSHPEAVGGFSDKVKDYSLEVNIPENIQKLFSEKELETVKKILSEDPRPSYQKDLRIYGFSYSGFEIKFKVNGKTLEVISAEK